LHCSAIILAGGFSSRFGQDKGLVKLAGKPLLNHVLDAVGNLADETIVAVSSQAQAESFRKVLGSEVNVVVDTMDLHGPLVGAMTGFQAAQALYAFLLPCDTPLVSTDVLRLLLELHQGKSAVIPRWPNCNIEPLQAVYCMKPACMAAKEALEKGRSNMQTMIDNLRGVRFVSTLVLQQLDPKLNTFFNVNTPLDLKRAEKILQENK
jgi:molybdopterin-guanine dinucleotide biosynthesis protein A